MLTELHIQQFALIDQVHIQCGPGMTVFSGETGAGKSILIDALGAAFGARASADWVRHGAKQAEVMAVCEVSDQRLQALLDEQGLGDDDILILRRSINSDGRSRAWINDRPASIGLLQEIGNLCLDFHGQHEHQALMQASFQHQLVDAQLDATELSSMKDAWKAWLSCRKKLEQHQQSQQQSGEQVAWMQQQCALFEALEIHADLEDELSQRVAAGQHQLQIQQSAMQALTWLDEDDARESSARSLVAQSIHDIALMAEHHPGLQEAHELLKQVDVLLAEIRPLLYEARDSELDQAAHEADADRLAALRDAMRRHHTDAAGLLDLLQSWQEKLSSLDTAAWDEESLSAELAAHEQQYRDVADRLHGLRQQAALQMAEALHPYMAKLGLGGMQLQVHIEAQQAPTHWAQSGWDDIAFMVSSNPGEPFRKLAQVASGGELSRLVLALKALGAYKDAPAIAVFDEVDVGIGGETAWCVGELLKEMSRERQVFVISHLPQVASCAQQQFHIVKAHQDGRTTTRLQPLSQDERTHEIARMLGGLDAESIQHARNMLARGSK
ncbi:MAG: DNA repair protein RecN [Zetaproteobacteria bacterium CG_4_9_14_3_um_filter_49_83]|nr:MAG: hypothetical protein AUJ56_00285 [Zetaproteobacteria bacterium CG1_02_49_23]PIQ32452.1 MAG: DNA repair protein RecN [Zetaproteobacteria bacterium CG17_big_fil_post_rev_8_21_14_2_50_50_13]PIV31309.1 MAG: DNA repair protein RecN [Zetaproteobacteria bacterium CG02_land_8_20_14_3_00_50_9]PIY55056.1 MAG: DNA repair protein RecN [Zetaproteobacteria bacterium CG_4_10_14_0_8_um_filter_49_80]PJA35931.1 MAG: DNA repair protein RecN [Zetaproteobacteria bacterium CG_4_9_14_3_um_filter_49_83]